LPSTKKAFRNSEGFFVLNTQQWIALRTGALQTNRPTTSASGIRTLVLNSLSLPTDITDEAIAALPPYNWQGEAYRPGSVRSGDISAQGGNEKTTFYISGAFTQQDAILRNVDFKRLGGKLNLTHKINSRLRPVSHWLT